MKKLMALMMAVVCMLTMPACMSWKVCFRKHLRKKRNWSIGLKN